MAETDETSKTSNGDLPRLIEISTAGDGGDGGGETLYGVLRDLISAIVSPEESPAPPVIKRARASICKNAPRLQDAFRNASRDLMVWTRGGSPLRALLVISVGTVTLLALTGFLVFMLFFLAATLNAIVIASLMSLAAAGGFLALFFASVTAIYIGALSVAIFVISITTISTISAVLIASGWVGFFWIIWLAAKKSMDVTVHSLTMTSSAISSYSAGRRPIRDESSKSSG